MYHDAHDSFPSAEETKIEEESSAVLENEDKPEDS